MATRPTPGSRDGSSSSTRPGSRSGGRPTTSNPRPASSDASSRRPARASLSPSPSFDKAVPSFLRPTVSSTLRSTSPFPNSRPSSSKGSPSPAQSPASAGRASRPNTPKRPPAQQPASSPRPITPRRSPVQPVNVPRPIAPAMDKAKAKSASTSRWSVASPRQLMQKASNAFKAGKIRSKKNKDLAGPASSAVASINKEAPGAASGEIKTETARALPVEVQQHRPPGTITAVPLDVQAEVEPKATQDEREEATSGEVVNTDHVKTEEDRGGETTAETPLDVQEEVIVEPNAAQNSTEIKTEEDSGQVEQVSTEEPAGDAETAIEEHKVMPEESVEAVEVHMPVPEEKPQTGNVEETEKESEKNTEDKLPPVAIVEEAAKEPTEPLNVQDEPATSTAKEEVVVETKAEERQREKSPKPVEITESSEKSVMPEEATESSEKSVMPEEATESSEKSVMPEEVTESSEKSVTISEEPKEQPTVTEKPQVEVADEEPKMIAASRASSLPATSLEEALEEMEATTKAQASTSRSEPVTPAKEAISKDKAVIDTLLSASAPTTPAKGDAKKSGTTPLMARIPEEMRFSFKGSRVKTAMEKRPEEAQPKKKEVARSNDVLEEAKGKLLEKKKSKVKALVGAFETVMDSPRASTPGGKSRPTPRGF